MIRITISGYFILLLMQTQLHILFLWNLGLIYHSFIASLLTYFCLLSKRRLYFVLIGSLAYSCYEFKFSLKVFFI